MNKCLNAAHLFCSINGSPFSWSRISWKLTYCSCSYQRISKWFDFCQEQGKGIAVSTQLVTLFTEHIFFFPHFSLHHTFHSLPPHHTPPPSKPLLFFSARLSPFSPVYFFFLFLSSHKWVHLPQGWDHGGEIRLGRGYIWTVARQRENEREKHQTAGWWLHGLFYNSKLAYSGFPKHIELTILVIWF